MTGMETHTAAMPVVMADRAVGCRPVGDGRG